MINTEVYRPLDRGCRGTPLPGCKGCPLALSSLSQRGFEKERREQGVNLNFLYFYKNSEKLPKKPLDSLR